MPILDKPKPFVQRATFRYPLNVSPVARPKTPQPVTHSRYDESAKNVSWLRRNWMTIGIGVLGTATSKLKADTLAMVSDTLGSVGDFHSTSYLHKMFLFPDEKLYVVAADRIEKAAELVAMIRIRLRSLAVRNHGFIQHALNECVQDYRRQRMTYEVLPKHMVTLEQWLLPMDEALRQAVMHDWMVFDMNCSLIVGTFTDEGQAILYEIPSVAAIQQEDGQVKMQFVNVSSFPGFCAIGTGAENANFWLCYRGHNLAHSPERSAYHAYEAKLMAESSPHVNEKIEMVIATAEGHVHLTDRKPQQGEWSLATFKGMFEQYGPKSTEALQFIKEQ
jgi:hypothetical protein